ncbi:30S ribosomal protein S6 [Coraliomargarita algicola]|uniref:Small ribosomal subunit protein bS6 n=1 Tax=Coraliomargarita algicola TaxID=3092156 RepID=A0ABZ0RQR4_9BACT|nr:30S ribosomal protein S6 [Coraliomargarita sp. J2-16]WPJ97584.1 30S ribosomal protein S6 [Coraliomargarita sp. J2-16]
MSATTKNNYKATFILDLRESEDDSAKVMADLNEILKSIGAEPSDSEDLGMREFARAADRRYTQGHYVEIYFAATGDVPATLNEKLKLDKRVNRIFTEAL